MPIIRHRSGPLAGQEQQIDPRADRITFGRDPTVCDVVFPPDLTIVARRHFALVCKPSGEWIFEDFGDPFVAVNGDPAEQAQTIRSGDVIELGKRGGPSFEIITGGKASNEALPVTASQEKSEGRFAIERRIRRIAATGIAVAVLAIGATGAVWYWSQGQGARLDRAVADLKKIEEQQREIAKNSISPADEDRLLKAAYVVTVRYANGREEAQGSASPVAPDLLATNAHVAEIRNQLKPGDRLFVRAPGPGGRAYEVIEIKIHPGYKAFQDFLKQDPFFVSSLSDPVMAATGYDVALLRVANDANLGPILEIASREELYALRPGMPLAIAGYPLEQIPGAEVHVIGATPNLRPGMVSALTDMFHLPTEPEHQKLITHNIPVTGGNSGSPIIGASGKLVGLINSGSVLRYGERGRMPNAAIINFGQRADMLLDLLSGEAEAALEAERAYWAKQTAAFKRGFDVIVPLILSEIKPRDGATPTQVGQTRFTLTKADQFKAQDAQGREVARRQKIHPVTIKAGVPASFIAYAQDKVPIEIYLVRDGQIVAQYAQRAWYPYISYVSDRDLTADIYIVGPDQDVSYTFLQYSWSGPPS